MNLVAASVKPGMGGKAKAGTVIKRKNPKSSDVQLNDLQVRNPETVSWVRWQFKLLPLCLLSSGTAYQRQH